MASKKEAIACIETLGSLLRRRYNKVANTTDLKSIVSNIGIRTRGAY